MNVRVGVLMGGMSIEREVSFNSGRTICDHLDTSRYDVVPLFQDIQGNLYILPSHFLHRGKIRDFELRLQKEATDITWDSLKHYVDFIYIALHGRYAEDGTLQGMLEVLGIPYLGAKVFASALRMDKIVQKSILHAHGIETPRGVHLYPDQILDYTTHKDEILKKLQLAQISFPCIVKPHKEGSSLGVSCVYTEQELAQALLKASSITPGVHQAVLIEELLMGMEFSCITITDYTTGEFIPLPPTEIVPEHGSKFYDYEQKYMPGRALKCTPARCTEEEIMRIQETCKKVTEILEYKTLSRIDGFLTTDNRVVIIDPNSLSGMGPASFIFLQAAERNMSHTNIINHLIETELHAYGMLNSIPHKTDSKNKMTNSTKIRVAVLFGGDSNEREVSLESGRNVVYKLSPTKYEVLPIFVSKTMELYHINQRLLVRNSTEEISQSLTHDMQIGWNSLPTIADFVFIALHGGKGENGSVQGALEMLKMPYNGSGVLASALCMDKYKTTEYLRNQGFDVPKAVLIALREWQQDRHHVLEKLRTCLSLPFIIKPHDDGCSVMVAKVHTIEEVERHVDELFLHNKTHALVEEFIQGMELTIGVMGNKTPKALPPSRSVAAASVLSIEEKFLPGAGENQTPAPLPERALEFAQNTVTAAYKAIGCKGYARIDCFYQSEHQSPTGKERLVIIEINSLPALTPATCIFHQAAETGIKPMDFIDLIVQYGLEEHQPAQKNTNT